MSCYNIVKAKESIAVSGTDDLVQSHFLLHHLTPSPPVSEFGGQQLLKITALPRMSETDNCWKSWRTVTVSSLPVCLASALPSLLISAMAVECQAPRLSAAMGISSIPCWRQVESYEGPPFWGTRGWIQEENERENIEVAAVLLSFLFNSILQFHSSTTQLKLRLNKASV